MGSISMAQDRLVLGGGTQDGLGMCGGVHSGAAPRGGMSDVRSVPYRAARRVVALSGVVWGLHDVARVGLMPGGGVQDRSVHRSATWAELGVWFRVAATESVVDRSLCAAAFEDGVQCALQWWAHGG